MTLLVPHHSGSTLVERRLGETAGAELQLLAHARDVGLLAKRLFRENAERGSTETGADASIAEDAEIDLLALNRKRPARLPRWRLDLPTEDADRSVCLQKWEGYVVEVAKDSFVARLVDRTSGGDEEEAVFPNRHVSADDRPLIRPGAVFYWNVGDETDVGGRQRTVSELRFRRLPALSNDDIAAARRDGKELHDWITHPANQD